MAMRIPAIFLALVFLCGYTITNAQYASSFDKGNRNWVGPNNDIEFDEDPENMASGDGKHWESDDEDFGESGSGSGSGLGKFDPDVEETFTPRPTTTTTTTRKPLSECQRQRENRAYMLTRYVPKCLNNGDFDALQCDGIPGTAECWCVDLHGKEIPGTRLDKSETPQCLEEKNLPRCTLELVKSVRSRLLGVERPQCNSLGLFERVQCHGSMCLCVDPNTGEKELGTMVHRPDQPDCGDESDRHNVETTTLRHDIKLTGHEHGIFDIDDIDEEITLPRGGETIDIDQTEESKSTSSASEEVDVEDNLTGLNEANQPWPDKFDGNDEDNKKDEDNDSSDEDIGEGSHEKHGGDKKDQHGHKDRVSRAGEFLTQPGILAGIIGGAVVLLLLLVLLLMLLLYRMRKKDEGSYPLDEPRRGPNNYAYVRAPDKEYYA